MDSNTDVTRQAEDLLFKLYNLKSKRGDKISIEEIFKELTDDSEGQKKDISYLILEVLVKTLKYLEIYQGHRFKITPIGFNFIQLKQKLSTSNTVFCAMWYHSTTNELYENGIKPAMRKLISNRLESIKNIFRMKYLLR